MELKYTHKKRKCESLLSALISMTLLYQPNIVYILFVFFFHSLIRKSRRNWDFACSGRIFAKTFHLKSAEDDLASSISHCYPIKRKKCVQHFIYAPEIAAATTTTMPTVGSITFDNQCEIPHTTSVHECTHYLCMCVRCAFWLTNSSLNVFRYMQHTSKIYASPFNSILYFVWPKIVFFPFLLNKRMGERQTETWTTMEYERTEWECVDSHSHFRGFNSLSSLICVVCVCIWLGACLLACVCLCGFKVRNAPNLWEYLW